MLVIRQIWFIGLVSLVSLTCLVSCGGGSDDDLLAPQPEAKATGGNIMTPITFGGKETEETSVTRAGTPLSDKVTSFMAWGYKDMSYSEDTKVYGANQQVMVNFTVNYKENSANTTASNTNGWEYVNQQPGLEDVVQSIKYWDWDAKAYRFFAVTNWDSESAGPYEAEKSYGADKSEKYEISMLADCSGTTKDEIAANIAATPYFSRLWFSNGVPMDYPDKQFGRPVTLEFMKPYTRVRFIFKYSYPRVGITLASPSFKPTDTGKKIARKGTVTVIYPITGPETQEWFSLTDVDGATVLTDFTENFDPEDDTKDYSEICPNGWYTVLPNSDQGSYTLSVSVNSVSKTVKVPAEFMQWQPGYSYTYVFKVTDEGGIEIGWVEYAVTPWTTEMEEDWEVYNW